MEKRNFKAQNFVDNMRSHQSNLTLKIIQNKHVIHESLFTFLDIFRHVKLYILPTYFRNGK